MISASSALLGREIRNCIKILKEIASAPFSHVSWFTYSGLLSSLSNAMTLAATMGSSATSKTIAAVLGATSAAESRVPAWNVLSQVIMLSTAESFGWAEYLSAASFIMGFIKLGIEKAPERAWQNFQEGGFTYLYKLLTDPKNAAASVSASGAGPQ